MKVLTEPCDACPFKGRFPSLRSGRIRSIIESCQHDDAHFHCHKTLVGPDGAYPDYDLDRNAICAGWLEAVGGIDQAPGQLIRIARRLGMVEYVDG